MLRGIQHVHFVGIGGIGMSGLAEILLNLGYKVTGSDLKRSDITDRLVELGATVFEGHAAKNVGHAGVVVVSSAVSEHNVEVQAAKRRRIPVIPRAQLLADLMRLKPHAIAVGGTHGKTTATSMISSILQEADIESTAIVGGILNKNGSNVAWGTGEYLVAETDEHDGSFLKLYPTVTVVTNIDPEHMEHYGTLDSLKSAFLDFINRVPFYGFSVLCRDDENVRSIIPEITSTCITYGLRRGADILAKDVKLTIPGNSLANIGRAATRFTVFNNSEKLGKLGRLGTVSLRAVGTHNVLNALAAITVGLGLGMRFSEIRAGLKLFGGVRRRFQLKGNVDGITVVEDYAHHPTEIEATLRAARALHPRRVIAVFQPHLYSRTKFFCNDFGRVLTESDHLVVTKIYATAREKPMPGVSAINVVKAARKAGHKSVEYIENKDDIPAVLADFLRPGDLTLFLGAGDIGKVSDRTVEVLKERERNRLELIREGEDSLSRKPRLEGAYQHIERAAPDATKRGEPLSRHTTWRVGGPADLWIKPRTVKTALVVLAFCQNEAVPHVVLGRGSNVLVSDAGYRGCIINLCGCFRRYRCAQAEVRCGAGLGLPGLVRKLAADGLAGLEFAAGIPGTLGGAVVKNAGAHGADVSKALKGVVVMVNGQRQEVPGEAIRFSYREAEVLGAVLEVSLSLRQCAPERVREKIHHFMEARQKSQPVRAWSAGCVFKNPPGDSAGRLIDSLGLKGASVGGAKVSEMHANFIVTSKGATAAEVSALIELVRGRVREETGTELEIEIELVGDFGGD